MENCPVHGNAWCTCGSGVTGGMTTENQTCGNCKKKTYCPIIRDDGDWCKNWKLDTALEVGQALTSEARIMGEEEKR